MNGRTVSKDLRVIAGKPYVSLGDMAKALGMTVQKAGGGYKLVAAGGAGPMASKLEGRIGDDIFTGEWRFKVLDFKSVEQYRPAHKGEDYTYGPKGSDQVLVVVNCRLKNGKPGKELIEFQSAVGQPINAQLTDMEEHGYEPILADVKLDYYNYAVYVLPGAAIDFAMVFSIPKSASPKDLIFTVHRYEDPASKKTPIRVHLK